MGDVKQVERETVTLKCGVNKNGGVAGTTILASVHDPATNLWLQWGDGSWGASEDQTAMSVGEKPWMRTIPADLSNVPLASHRIFPYYEISAGPTAGVDFDELIMGTAWHDLSAVGSGLTQADVRTAVGLAAADLDTQLANKATAANLATMQGNVTDILADTSEIQTNVAAGVAAWVTADLTGVATEAKQDLIDTVVDAILVQTTAGGLGPWTTGAGGAVLTAQDIRDALGMAFADLDTQLDGKATAASIVALAADATAILADTAAIEPLVTANLNATITSRLADGAVDLSPSALIAIWNKVQTSETWATNSFGEFLDALVSAAGSGGLTVQNIVDGVWDEVLPGNHSTATTAGAILQGAGSGGVDYGLLEAAVWGATATDWLDGLTMGGILNGAGAGNTPEVVAAAVWAQSAGGAGGTFGGLLDAQVSLMATAVGLSALDTKADDILVDTGTDIPTRFNALDADTLAIQASIDLTATSVELAAVEVKVDDILTDTGTTLPTTLSGKASQASVDARASQVSVDSIAGNVAATLVDTSVTLPGLIAPKATSVEVAAAEAKVDTVIATGDAGPWTSGGAIDEAGVRSALGMAAADLDDQLDGILAEGGPGPWTTADGFAVAGSEMGLTTGAITAAKFATGAIDSDALSQAALEAIADYVWDESQLDHVGLDTMGESQQASGGGTTPSQIRDAVWDAPELDHQDGGSMGAAQTAAKDAPSSLGQLLRRFASQRGPAVVRAPVAAKDEIHVGDLGVVLNTTILDDGAVVDLTTAVSVTYYVQAPGTDVAVEKPGLAVVTPLGSYASWTSDADAFGTAGRWWVQSKALMADTTELWSNKAAVHVLPDLPLI